MVWVEYMEKEKKFMKHNVKNWIPVVCWCGLIFFLSSQPHLPGPEDKTWDFLLKKLGHICAYGMLYFWVFRAFESSTKHRVIKSFVFCILYACSDEYHQSFVPGRTPMVRDVGIDIIGMSISCLLQYKTKYGKVNA